MENDPNETSRLEPLVKFAYTIYCGDIPKQPAGDPVPGDPMSKEHYVASVKREIQSVYSFPEAGLPLLLAKARSGELGMFSDSDCTSAVELLNYFLGSCLMIESELGDGEHAVEKLKFSVPGFSADFYNEVMRRVGYYKR